MVQKRTLVEHHLWCSIERQQDIPLHDCPVVNYSVGIILVPFLFAHPGQISCLSRFDHKNRPLKPRHLCLQATICPQARRCPQRLLASPHRMLSQRIPVNRYPYIKSQQKAAISSPIRKRLPRPSFIDTHSIPHVFGTECGQVRGGDCYDRGGFAFILPGC